MLSKPDLSKLKVSCLMVSRPHPKRFSHFKMSVQCFLRQTYPNRELLILCDRRGDPKTFNEMEKWINSLGRDDIRLSRGPRTSTLGLLRNKIFKFATGEVCCLWDDDDLFHPERIRIQLNHMIQRRSRAVYLQDLTHYIETKNEIFFADWSRAPVQCHAGTGMFFAGNRATYPNRGLFCEKHEDREFFLRMRSKTKVSFLKGKPHLYVYKFHGENTLGAGHHDILKMFFIKDHKSASRRRLSREIESVFAGMIRFPVKYSKDRKNYQRLRKKLNLE